jgi:hypothetical protein
VLAESGDDPRRYTSPKARKNYAATSPVTRQSGKRKPVMARYAHNDQLRDALDGQAFAALTASPGARAYYDRQRARGLSHRAALRQLANGSSGSCTAARRPARPTTRRPPGRSTPARKSRLPLDI